MQGFSQAADKNKAAILAVLADWLPQKANLLEIGSGSGQHAIHMAGELKHINWWPSDRTSVLPMLTDNVAAYGSANILTPISLDLVEDIWPAETFHCAYSANVMHIVSSELGEKLIRGAAQALEEDGLLLLYGPYKYAGNFNTLSNADFDLWLKERDPRSGIRDFEWVRDLAARSGLRLLEDRQMPANNQLLVFKSTAS